MTVRTAEPSQLHARVMLCYVSRARGQGRAFSSPQSMIVTACDGVPLPVPTASTTRTTSMPLVTAPKATCRPSFSGAVTQVMKNPEPFVLGPEFAIDNTPGRSCLSRNVSSANRPPKMLSALPPPCTHQPGSARVEAATDVIQAWEKGALMRDEGARGTLKLWPRPAGLPDLV